LLVAKPVYAIVMSAGFLAAGTVGAAAVGAAGATVGATAAVGVGAPPQPANSMDAITRKVMMMYNLLLVTCFIFILLLIFFGFIRFDQNRWFSFG
jgi:hypothetical protein